jgi:glycosyltransferase involved in cell wall biosynthesis
VISALVLTLNEEVNIARCLRSLTWCDDVVVLDSYSTDRTIEIARSFNARVVQRSFDNWSNHQNWANQNISFKHPWVYYSDADEVIPVDLRNEMLDVVSRADDSCAAYRLRYRNFFRGRWIRHCGIYPVWVTRLFRPQRIKWERLVNPVASVDGAVGNLKGHFEHYSFSKGMSAWFQKHNHYSDYEALETIRSLSGDQIDWRKLLPHVNSAERRLTLKKLSFRLPGRPLLRFVYMYLVRLGFLDGLPGLHYCILLSIYEYMIVLKVREIVDQSKANNV